MAIFKRNRKRARKPLVMVIWHGEHRSVYSAMDEAENCVVSIGTDQTPHAYEIVRRVIENAR